MRRIYKYELEVTDRQKVSIHKRAKILSVQVQRDKVCLWAEIDTEERIIERDVFVVGTGHDIHVPYHTAYVGTFQLLDGDFVGHVYA